MTRRYLIRSGAAHQCTLVRSVYEHDESIFGDGLTRRSAKRSQAVQPPLERRGAPPRPRKPDETLSRHGLGARRVALLAPRGVLSKYWHPLSYAGAITKIYVKFKSKSRILGDGKLIPSGGGVPEGRRGSLTPMSGDGGLFISPSTPNTPSEHPRDGQLIRSVPEHDAPF